MSLVWILIMILILVPLIIIVAFSGFVALFFMYHCDSAYDDGDLYGEF